MSNEPHPQVQPLPEVADFPRPLTGGGQSGQPQGAPVGDLAAAAWYRTCFYSGPIDEPSSYVRRHADIFLNFLVKPAIEALDPNMRVVRADQLASSLITAGLFDHVKNARLMIADLSFHNPNVFQELGARGGHELPLVLISRDEDPIPSNLRDTRTVLVSTDPLTLIEKRAHYRSEIERYSRWALSTGSEGRA